MKDCVIQSAQWWGEQARGEQLLQIHVHTVEVFLHQWSSDCTLLLEGQGDGHGASGLPDQTSQALQSQSANETLRLSGMWPEDTDYLRLHMVISEGI